VEQAVCCARVAAGERQTDRRVAARSPVTEPGSLHGLAGHHERAGGPRASGCMPATKAPSLKPAEYTWSCLACRIGHLIWKRLPALRARAPRAQPRVVARLASVGCSHRDTGCERRRLCGWIQQTCRFSPRVGLGPFAASVVGQTGTKCLFCTPNWTHHILAFDGAQRRRRKAAAMPCCKHRGGAAVVTRTRRAKAGLVQLCDQGGRLPRGQRRTRQSWMARQPAAAGTAA
jgi:hypothetical protein